MNADSLRCIEIRNKLNAAIHGNGAVIDDLETATMLACQIIKQYRELTKAQQATTLNSDKTACIDKGYHWRKITKDTPLAGKKQLINRNAGSATTGYLRANEEFFTHWAPVPTFKD